MEILRAEKVRKNFGGLVALKGIDFSLKEGEILGMIGPNGSGKTTLFNSISGTCKPSSGEVFYKGERITAKKPHEICRMGIARTFQIVQPFTEMTVSENILVGAMYGGGLSLEEGWQRSNEILEFIGLQSKRNSYPGNITTPDRRRLELARALSTGPKVILLDETMAGLNPSEIDEALQLLKRINERGITLFIIEHVMKAVMGISERVIVLDYGEKIAEGRPEEVANNREVIKAYLGERYV